MPRMENAAPKYVLRIETGVHARCAVEGIILVFVFLKIGVCNATCWAFVSREVFSEASLQFLFYGYPFIVNVVRGILPFS